MAYRKPEDAIKCFGSTNEDKQLLIYNYGDELFYAAVRHNDETYSLGHFTSFEAAQDYIENHVTYGRGVLDS